MSSTSTMSVAIIGAGIAGITLAIALSEKNPSLRLTIFESRLRFSEISAGVGFGPNAIKAMDLISPKMTEAYSKVKTTNLWPEKANTWFDIRYGDGPMAGDLIAEMKSQEGFMPCSASRAQFLEKLVELLPSSVDVKFGRRVVDVRDADENESGKMRVRFEDGTEAYADAVVGCDGIRSACRRILLGENDRSSNAVYSGKYAYRKVADMKKAVAAVGPEVQNREMFLGHRGHILTFPIRNGKALNMAVFRDAEGAPWTQRQWVVPSSKKAVLRDFEGWGSKAMKLLELIDEPEKWALFDLVPPSTFAKGGFCILGDAAHASTPHLGAGAGFAIEDVHLLAGLLAPDLIRSSSDIKRAFSMYDTIRRPRCEELIKRSRKEGVFFDSHGTGEIDGDELKKEVATHQEWVWNVDLEDMLKKAKVLLQDSIEINQPLQ